MDVLENDPEADLLLSSKYFGYCIITYIKIKVKN